jgi:D-glycero-alpha-D-manno-heptose-7-phosphate kinase
MVISKTPLRVSFVGGGTDLPSFYENNEYGQVLSTSIDKYIYVTIKKHTKLFNERIRLNYSETELVNDLDEIDNMIIRESLKFLGIDERLYISTIADIPGSSGLGSSSTFCVGLLNALYAYKGERVSNARLAEEAAHIEIDRLQRPMGKQDHYGAAIGGMNALRFNADGSVNIKPIFLSSENSNRLFENLITFWTGVTRKADSVLTEQDKNNSKNSDLLIDMRDQVDDLYEMLNNKSIDLNSFGGQIHKNWEMKKQLASNISNNTINDAYERSVEIGAYGGKISGAGNGGFLNVLADKKHHTHIISDLEKMGMMYVKFGYDSTGSVVNSMY